MNKSVRRCTSGLSWMLRHSSCLLGVFFTTFLLFLYFFTGFDSSNWLIAVAPVNISQMNSNLLRVANEFKNSEDFEGFDNETGSPDLIVPNIVHFLRFNQTKFRFVDAMCVLAAVKNQQPDRLILHTNVDKFEGIYWEMLLSNPHFKRIYEIERRELPFEIFGQQFNTGWHFQHASDVTRLRMLMEHGGVFLDSDTYLIQKLDRFRHFEFALNWDEDEVLGCQTLIAHRYARFLNEWLESYRGNYRSDLWYYNAGERPTTEVLMKKPYLIHRVKKLFGVASAVGADAFKNYNPDWRKLYCLHLLINHRYYLDKENFEKVPEFDENNIRTYGFTIGEMLRDVLYWHESEVVRAALP